MPFQPPRPLSVLIVDDSHDAAEALRTLLAFWGYEARLAHDRDTALAAVGSHQPDVILLDVDMSGADGGAGGLLSHLGGLTPKRPLVVAVTGFNPYLDRSRPEAGVDHFLGQPYDLEELRRILDAQPPP
jgi:two-component system, OmpR family, response regulator MprA